MNHNINNGYMGNKLSNFIYNRFQKIVWDSTFYCNHARKMEKKLQTKKNICVLFMDLSKTFDTVNHDPLLPKLLAYGFSKNSLNLICSYLKNGKRRVQIYNNLSAAKTIIAVVPQDSVDGSPLFNIFINFLATLSNRNYVE